MALLGSVAAVSPALHRYLRPLDTLLVIDATHRQQPVAVVGRSFLPASSGSAPLRQRLLQHYLPKFDIRFCFEFGVSCHLYLEARIKRQTTANGACCIVNRPFNIINQTGQLSRPSRPKSSDDRASAGTRHRRIISMSAGGLALNAALYLRHSLNTYIYYRSHGRLPNYVEPRSFNEKVQWRKLFDRNSLFPCFVDKLAVRAYVSRRAPTLKFPRFLWSGSDPNAIPYADLPERFVIKPNHRSGDVLFVRSRSEFDRERIVTTCQRWLSRPYGR